MKFLSSLQIKYYSYRLSVINDSTAPGTVKSDKWLWLEYVRKLNSTVSLMK